MRHLTDFFTKSGNWRIMCVLLVSSLTLAQEHNHDTASNTHTNHHEHTAKMHVDHSEHQRALKSHQFELKEGVYPVQDVQLLDQNNQKVHLANILSQDRPIALNFIFTTCTTICPVMTATFSQMHQQLSEGSLQQLQTISISIDPQYDRPKQLDEYAKQFNADKSWAFLTGDSQDIINILKSFDVYTGSKLNHRPVALFRQKNSERWLRVEGLASGQDLAKILEHQILNQ